MAVVMVFPIELPILAISRKKAVTVARSLVETEACTTVWQMAA